MSKLQPVRGTQDILPEEARLRRHVIDTARAVAERFGYGEIHTPIFEFSEVFTKTLGDTSDVVTKEMYAFTDRGGEALTLRPELTAPICRAFISHSMKDQLPLKFFSYGPAFRYERPQKGRFRQFHQLDAELLGVEGPEADIEIIALGWQILCALGLKDKVKLELNSLGDAASRTAYREALVAYYRSHFDRLSEDSKLRFEKNPLRILDSKDEGDKAINANAPSIGQHYSPEAGAFFKAVTDGLAALNIPYVVNARIVRGLDYYSHTVFEFTTDALGAQNTVLGGGRYNELIEAMGGPATAGIGWGAGIERICGLVAEIPPAKRPIAVVPVGEAAEIEALKLTHALREQGFTVDLGYRGNVAKRMKRADKLNAVVALMLGEDEIAAGKVTLKLLDTGEQREVAREQLLEILKPFH